MRDILGIAVPFAGGLAPIIAVVLLGTYHGSYVPIALYIIILAVFSFVTTLGLKELSRSDISQEEVVIPIVEPD